MSRGSGTSSEQACSQTWEYCRVSKRILSASMSTASCSSPKELTQAVLLHEAETFDRDLWDTSKSVVTIDKNDDALALTTKGEPSVLVVYAPWCQYCQAMEDEFDKVSGVAGVPTYKFRGDEQREFVDANLNTKSFPTINFVGADGSVTKYESEDRSVDALKAFAASKGKVEA